MAERLGNRASIPKVAGSIPRRKAFTLLASGECPCTYCKLHQIRASAKRLNINVNETCQLSLYHIGHRPQRSSSLVHLMVDLSTSLSHTAFWSTTYINLILNDNWIQAVPIVLWICIQTLYITADLFTWLFIVFLLLGLMPSKITLTFNNILHLQFSSLSCKIYAGGN